MTITRKQRLRKALRHEVIDSLPTQVNHTDGMAPPKMEAHFQIAAKDLPIILGNHMVRVNINTPPRLSADGKVKFDWWGIGFDIKEEGYLAAVNPLKDNPNLDAYSWPDPTEGKLFEKSKPVMINNVKEFAQEFCTVFIGRTNTADTILSSLLSA